MPLVERATCQALPGGYDPNTGGNGVGANPVFVPPIINAQSGTSYTFAYSDSMPGTTVVFGSGSSTTATIPTTATIAAATGGPGWSIGSRIRYVANGAGQVTVAAASGVTIHTVAATLKSNGQYSVVDLVMVAADVWVASGSLAAS